MVIFILKYNITLRLRIVLKTLTSDFLKFYTSEDNVAIIVPTVLKREF